MKDIKYSKIKNNLYAIEKDGRVYSYYKNDYMKTKLDKDGYLCLSLKNNSNGYSKFGIHRLLMIVYCPIEDMENMTVNHIDGNKLNNNLNNLEWVTASENTRLAHEIKINNVVGENHPKAILTEEEVKIIIQMIKEGYGTKEIRKIIPKVNKGIISGIKHNRTWKHLPR